MFGEHGILGRLQHAIETAQHDHRQHDQSVLRRAIRPAQQVRDLPDFSRNFFVSFCKHKIPQLSDRQMPARNDNVIF